MCQHRQDIDSMRYGTGRFVCLVLKESLQLPRMLKGKTLIKSPRFGLKIQLLLQLCLRP